MNDLTFTEWMHLNGAQLARAIVTEGGMHGPTADKMLSEAQFLDGSRSKGQKILRMYLKMLGGEHHMPDQE